MKAYVTFTRKRLFIIMAVFVCSALICCEIYAVGNQGADADTNAERLSFIKAMGCTAISDEPSVKTVTIPESFSDVYQNYNSLQQSAGYDLTLYKGCEVNIYSYKINTPADYTGECVINIMVYNNRIIGGDISSLALGGFMLPLKQVKK